LNLNCDWLPEFLLFYLSFSPYCLPLLLDSFLLQHVRCNKSPVCVYVCEQKHTIKNEYKKKKTEEKRIQQSPNKSEGWAPQKRTYGEKPNCIYRRNNQKYNPEINCTRKALTFSTQFFGWSSYLEVNVEINTKKIFEEKIIYENHGNIQNYLESIIVDRI
jgi:hypothetical protein